MIAALAILASACSSSNGGGSGATGGKSGGGGASSQGGTTASGGVTGLGGQPGTGGATGTGGRVGSGGATETGGQIGSGGAPGSGGRIGSGGTTATGGAPGSGGRIGSGGTTATGGASSAGGQTGSGGTTGSGGSTVAGGQTGSGGASASGGRTGRDGGPGADGAAMGGNSGTGGGTTSGGTSGTGAPSAGCGKTSTLTFTTVPNESGTKVGTGKGGYVTIQSGGQSRGFAMRLPDNYDNTKPYWLIFGFHWNGGNSAEVDSGGTNGYWWAYYGLQRKSNNGAIFVAPDGIGAGWPNSGGRDLTFADDMVKLIEDNYCVDTANIITSGFSYGGGMSYELACARAKVFRAAVIYEGGQLSGCDGGSDPIALWQLEGLTDTTVGMSMATPIRDRFVKNNGCTAQNPPQPPQPGTYLNPGGHICTDYAGCSAGHPVRWCVSQSGHGPGPIDGNSDLYNSCATPPKSCSTSCPCTWTPDDVWPWLNGQTISGQTPNATK
jgi:poly(3-hydroxybutyrate) depolymerase